jgi:haloacetate dehalogenase
VSRLALLDIVPTRHIYERLDQARATSVWRYFFLIQPADLPERLIGSERLFYLRRTLEEWSGEPLAPEALAEYERCFDATTIHAGCEDYRAGATIDLEHDRADEDASSARHSCCGARPVWALRTTSSPRGATRGATCVGARSTAATSSPRSGRAR